MRPQPPLPLPASACAEGLGNEHCWKEILSQWKNTIVANMSGSKRRSWSKVLECRPTEYEGVRASTAVIRKCCHWYWRYRSMTRRIVATCISHYRFVFSCRSHTVRGCHWWAKTTGLLYQCLNVWLCRCVHVNVYVCVCMHVCVCTEVWVCTGYVCMCLRVCMCMCAHDREKELTTPSLHMHISTMDRLQHWVQKRLGGKLIEENLELKHVQCGKNFWRSSCLQRRGFHCKALAFMTPKNNSGSLFFTSQSQTHTLEIQRLAVAF